MHCFAVWFKLTAFGSQYFAVASWTAPVLWRFRLARLHCQSARRLAHSKTWRGLRQFMESPLSFFHMHGDHERRTSRTVPPTRCCRRPVGRAFLRFLCRQDAGSTLWFMETLRMRTDLHRSRHQSKLND